MKQRSSIKYKLFLATGIIAVIFIGVFLALNIFFFGRYYIYSKKNTLIDIYQKVDSIYSGDISAVTEELMRMENNYGVRISIQDEDAQKYDTIFNSGKDTPPPANPNQFDVPVPHGFRPFEYNKEQLLERGYTFSKLRDTPGNNEFLSLIGTLQNDDTLIVRIPVAYLEETSQFTTIFLLIAGFVTMLVCVVVAYYISRHFSKPLIEINEVATSMATLDFEKKYTGKSTDEIGQLGNSINQLSFHLQNAIEDLKQSNQLLAEEVQKERRIDEMRKEFVINVSHELKTPIALVQGYAEGLKINVNSSEDDKNYYCDIIIDEASRMNRLVMQLLDLSRIEIGNVKPDMAEIDLESIAKEVVFKTKLLSDAKNLTVDFSGMHGVALGDFDMIGQVFTNYLTNAIRHSPNYGKIVISSETVSGKVRVSVFNQGDSIPEEDIPKLWEKFYKVDKARTRTDGGTGIGLSIVKAIMEAHGGSYGVCNREGMVEFYFELDSVSE